MIITIQTSDPRPIYLQIMDEVRRALVVGSLEPEDALPSVRQLATELRVNPNTVQQAYRELEREGVVYKRRGLGTFASAIQSGKKERQKMAQELAERMLQEAYRQGLSIEELLSALQKVARNHSSASNGSSAPTEKDKE